MTKINLTINEDMYNEDEFTKKVNEFHVNGLTIVSIEGHLQEADTYLKLKMSNGDIVIEDFSCGMRRPIILINDKEIEVDFEKYGFDSFTYIAGAYKEYGV